MGTCGLVQLKKILLIYYCCIVSAFCFGQPGKRLEPTLLLGDLAFLKEKLQKNHPNLYLYTEKKQIDQLFDSLAAAIRQPMTEQEFYHHLTIISSVIKDGHTIILPPSKFITYHNANSQFLPYKIRVVQGKLFVEMVCTADKRIPEGAEIVSINQVAASEILQQLMERQIRDGWNETYPRWILDQYFREYYSFHFGHPDTFDIQFRVGSVVKQLTIQALRKDSIHYYRQAAYPGNSNEKRPGQGIVFAEDIESGSAWLQVKDFHHDVLRDDYKQDFRSEIRKAFQRLKENKLKNLVLDLRDNQGGDIEYGVYLLSYLMKEPFSVVDGYFKIKSSEEALERTGGPSLGQHPPVADHFEGTLYVLINGGSFSNSGIVSATLRKHQRAVFIGEETGGNNKVLAGDAKDFTLPHSGIYVEIPTRQYLLDSQAPLSGHGTVPDFEILPTIEDWIHNRDPQKEEIKKMIGEKKGKL